MTNKWDNNDHKNEIKQLRFFSLTELGLQIRWKREKEDDQIEIQVQVIM